MLVVKSCDINPLSLIRHIIYLYCLNYTKAVYDTPFNANKLFADASAQVYPMIFLQCTPNYLPFKLFTNALAPLCHVKLSYFA